MGQRSQIYIRINKKLVVANYYGWNYGERMISRAKGIIEWLQEYIEKDCLHFFTEENRLQSYKTQLRRICDINFDMRDYQVSCDIVKEWREQFAEQPFNKSVFNWQDNNDGQLFIDIQGKTVKYCFTKFTRYKQALDGNHYMAWDSRRNWTIPTDYMMQEDIDLCKENIKYISEHAEVMTVAELKEFVTADYSQQIPALSA